MFKTQFDWIEELEIDMYKELDQLLHCFNMSVDDICHQLDSDMPFEEMETLMQIFYE